MAGVSARTARGTEQVREEAQALASRMMMVSQQAAAALHSGRSKAPTRGIGSGLPPSSLATHALRCAPLLFIFDTYCVTLIYTTMNRI